ncbi:PREDICTED: uncharacterized protein LOC105368791 [Ceratosolen solmsi marchali]|uniref:Uncharacterized protein LOC105368791 n=1 Tax=Ceratosolen solmsi marchali TaxID=326594 RepID=A0AAJ6YXH3_9HYME|nr:PREDICTED: uncharacterized protein LOC105368791 [Ceratosolen solmsi marchali]
MEKEADNPETAAVENSPTDNKTNKRRSLVFKRRSILYEQDLENVGETGVVHEAKKLKFEDVNQFDIKKYIETLNEEDRKWREVYAKRKSRVQDLIKHNKHKEQAGQILDINFLSDHQRAFLALKPDYKEFNKNVFQLQAIATKVMFLNICSKHFYESVITTLQEDTNNIMHRIFNLID